MEYLNTVINADVLDGLRMLPDESVQMCVTSPPRTTKGRFIKGHSYSEATQFKKGQHWRKRKPFWDKAWLETEYIEKQRSCSEIAKEFGLQDTAIHFWLKKHGIKARTVSECRKVKKWGASGASNPMFGRVGKLNPRWNGGHSPERQCLYARAAWKEVAKNILKRDGYKCTKCGATHTSGNKLTVHHIKHWAKYPELRFDEGNLKTLCLICHKSEHSRR